MLAVYQYLVRRFVVGLLLVNPPHPPPLYLAFRQQGTDGRRPIGQCRVQLAMLTPRCIVGFLVE